jgi:hypothetical protein
MILKIHDLRFGVELETVQKTRKTVATAICSVVGGEARHVDGHGSYDPWIVVDRLDRIWNVVADASLSNVPSNLRAEVVSPILTYSDIPELQEVVRAVRKCGAQVDEKCGLHLHVGTEGFDGRALANLAKTFYKYEPLIIAALGVNEQRMHQYAKPLSPEFIVRLQRLRSRTKDEVNRAWYGEFNNNPTRYCSSRYQTMNLNSVFYRGTVEFRMFEATLHAGKAKAAIQFSLALCAKALNSRGASSRKREFDATSARYDFRVFLLRLGLIGDEYATARKHLLAAMPGDTAWKHGRPKTLKPATDTTEVGCGA